MKTILKIAVAGLLLIAGISTPVVAEGPGPQPSCPGFPNCLVAK